MGNVGLPLEQFPGRNHVIGSPEAPAAVVYFTAVPTLDEVLAKRLLSKQQKLRCTVTRDLMAGTEQGGTVILSCEKEHHMDLHAHRMTNPDGSVTTWRA